MRIALISDVVYPYHMGGKERRLDEVSRRLAAAGHDVHVYTMQWWEGGKERNVDGVHLHAISKKYELYQGERRSIKQGVLFALACFKMFGQKFDVAEVDHMPYFPLYSMWFVCLLKRKPMLATWHEVWGHEYWKTYLGGLAGTIAYWIERCSIFLPKQFVAVSPYTARRLREEYGVKSKRIIMSTNGTNLDVIRDAKANQKHASDVIFVGRLLSHKNVDTLMRAIAIVKKTKPTVHCVIVGKGPELKNLKQLAKKLSVTKNVTFMAPIEKNSDLFGVMKASKVFVSPSEREGFGLIALEANAAGLPVLTFNTPGNATVDLIETGKNGALFTDEAELAELLEQYITKPSMRATVERHASAYDWNSTVQPLLERYTA